MEWKARSLSNREAGRDGKPEKLDFIVVGR